MVYAEGKNKLIGPLSFLFSGSIFSFRKKMMYSLASLEAEQVINWKQLSVERNFGDNSSSNRLNIYSVEKARLACLLFFNTLNTHTPPPHHHHHQNSETGVFHSHFYLNFRVHTILPPGLGNGDSQIDIARGMRLLCLFSRINSSSEDSFWVKVGLGMPQGFKEVLSTHWTHQHTQCTLRGSLSCVSQTPAT